MGSNGDKTKICDEKYHFFFEDSDFCERARRRGYKVISVYSAISHHRGDATIGSQSAKFYSFHKRGRLRFIIKHFSIVRMFVASTWWVFEVLSDTIRFFPLTQRFLLFTGIQNVKYEHRGRAIIDVVFWNINNMKDHFRARIEETTFLDKNK
jgi:GT2 family glycosyltransferase